MISLLHERDYEMVGNTEVRLEDWQRMRVGGGFRFVVQTASKTVQAKVAFWLIVANFPEVFFWRKYIEENSVLLVFASYIMLCAFLGAYRVWGRCERRFNRG